MVGAAAYLATVRGDYKKFVKSLKSKAFKLNPYDGCVANKIVKGKQITICFHVDNCKISHEVPQVIDETIDWLKAEYEPTLYASRISSSVTE